MTNELYHALTGGVRDSVKILSDSWFDSFEACQDGDDRDYPEPTVRLVAGL